MENKEISFRDMLRDIHIGLERQGPGGREITIRALSFIDGLGSFTRTADLGCGTGGQTMVLAQHITGTIVGVDFFPEFIDVFNDKARRLNVQERVSGIVGLMEDLPFEKEAFDLIWSEGAIDSIGFERGLSHWIGFLKRDGYIAVSSPAWFTDDHPAEVAKFWDDAGSGLGTVGRDILTMQRVGLQFVAAFALPEKCWTDNYFVPREAAEKALSEKYAGSKAVEAYLKNDRREVELYSRYKRHYGYVFYIGKKV